MQIAGIAAIANGRVTGAQLASTAAIATDHVEGAQLSLVNVAASGVRGAQLGLVNSVAGLTEGAQVGLINTVAGATEGLQLGLINVAAGRVSGVQVGLINVSGHTDASFGLVNAHADGRINVRAGADTTGLFGVSLVHGSRFTHSIFSLAVDPLGKALTGAFGLGLGGRIGLSELLHIDIDALAHVLVDDGTLNDQSVSFLVEPRVTVTIAIVPGIVGIYLGASYQWLFGPTIPGISGPLFSTTTYGDPGTATIHGWPALSGGVELF
jgi:hypothetical protein